MLLCAIVGYFILVSQYYPISGDDFRYRFHYQNQSELNSFSDIVDSNIYQYEHHTGRFLAHCIIQYFMSFGGFIPFYILSSFMWGLLLFSLIWLVRYKSHRIKGDLMYILFAILLIVPMTGTLLWGTVAMTVNYMYSAAIYFSFLVVYLYIRDKKPILTYWLNSLLFIFGLICGSWQESFAIGIAGTLFLYHIYTINQTKGSALVLLIGFGIGTALLIFAPGNFERAYEATGNTILTGSLLLWQLKHVFFSDFFVLSWMYILAFSIVFDKIKYKKARFALENKLWFAIGATATIVSIVMATLDLYQGPWQSTIQAFIGVILLSRMIAFYYEKSRYKKILSIAPYFLGALLVFLYVPTVINRTYVKTATNNWERQIIDETSNHYYDGELRSTINSIYEKHPILFSLICPIYHCGNYDYLLPKMNKYFALGRSIEGSYFLPEPPHRIVETCSLENQIGENIYKAEKPYLVIVSNDKHEQPQKLMVLTYPTTLIKRWGYKLRKKDGLTRIFSTENMHYVECVDKRYYIQYLDFENFHNRSIKKGWIE